MSRSYKKTPVTKDSCRSSSNNKKIANRVYRRNNKMELHQRKAYKKYYETWNIHDYVFLYPKEQAIRDYYEREYRHLKRMGYPTLESWLNYWEKHYRRK